MFSSLIKDWRRHYYHSGSDWLPLHIEIYLPATGAAGRGQLLLCSALFPPTIEVSENGNCGLNTPQQATVCILTLCLGFALQRGFDSMDPFIPVSVPNYSEKEFESCYLYYTDRRWLQHPQCKW